MRWHGFFFLVKLFLSFCWFLFKLFWSSETNGNFLIVCCPSKSPISIYLPKVLQCYGYIDPYKFPHYTLTICQTNLLQNCSKKCDNLIYTSSVQMNIYFGLNQIVKFYLSNQNWIKNSFWKNYLNIMREIRFSCSLYIQNQCYCIGFIGLLGSLRPPPK